jgi:hypothetical protein
MQKMAKNESSNLRVGEISGILVLVILDKLGTARLPEIFKGLELATKKGKAPFFVGSSISQVLQWQVRRQQVSEKQTGHSITYSITGEGKRVARTFRPLMRQYFPNLSKVRAHADWISA